MIRYHLVPEKWLEDYFAACTSDGELGAIGKIQDEFPATEIVEKDKIRHNLVSTIVKELKYIQQTQSNLPNQSKSVQMCINAVKKILET